MPARRRGNHKVGLSTDAVRNHAASNRWQYLLDVVIVEAQDCRAVKRNFVDEVSECSPNCLDVGVVIEMLAVYVRDDRDNRRQFQE